MSYSYKRITGEQIESAQYLIWKSYQKRLSLDYLNAKYNTLYSGRSYFGTIAYDGQKPIAMYGAIPQKFVGKGQEHILVHTCDSFTLPEYQRKGLHRDLALFAYDQMREEGVTAVYAFHSENTYHSCKKLNWIERPSMSRFHFATGVLPVSKLLNRIGQQHVINLLVDKVLKEFWIPEADNPSKVEGKIGQLYDRNFLAYKDSFFKHVLLEIEGCTFYLKVDAVAHVGYFNCPNANALKLAIEVLKSKLLRIGVPEILFQVDPTSNQYRIISQLRDPLPSWKTGYLNFVEDFNIEDYQFNYADFDTY